MRAVLCGVCGWMLCLSVWAEAGGYRALVLRVVDGDTVWLQPERGGPVRKTRIEGIDAPEICQADGRAARDTLRSLLHRQWVEVRSVQRDNYGRDLGRLQWQGQDVGEWMVREGWAWSYRWQGEPGPYATQERQAVAEQRGVHRRPQALYPGSFRRVHGPCHPR
jgi:micrococcal nuclease